MYNFVRLIRKQLDILKAVAFATYKEWSVYRSHSMVSLFVGPVYFLVQYFIWKAVFKTHESVSGLSLEQMITYFAIASLINYIIMDFADWNLQMLIHTGKFLTFVLRPMSHVYFAFSQKVGHRVLGVVFEFLPPFLITPPHKIISQSHQKNQYFALSKVSAKAVILPHPWVTISRLKPVSQQNLDP